MSWYSTNYTKRAAIALDNTASGSGTISWNLAIPKDWDQFWNNIQSDGDDIRLCEADGFTEIDSGKATAFDLGTSWNASTRTGNIRVNGWTGGTANKTCLVWMYWGYASATAGTFGAYGAPTTVTARVAKEGRRGVRSRIATQPEPPGATRPRNFVSKTSSEKLDLYLDFEGELLVRDRAYNGRFNFEEISTFTVTSEKATVDTTSTMLDITNVSVIGDSGAMVRVRTKAAGTSGDDHTVKAVVTTTEGRILERRLVLKVRNAVET